MEQVEAVLCTQQCKATAGAHGNAGKPSAGTRPQHGPRLVLALCASEGTHNPQQQCSGRAQPPQ